MTRFEAIGVLLLVTAFDPSIAIQREDNKKEEAQDRANHGGTEARSRIRAAAALSKWRFDTFVRMCYIDSSNGHTG